MTAAYIAAESGGSHRGRLTRKILTSNHLFICDKKLIFVPTAFRLHRLCVFSMIILKNNIAMITKQTNNKVPYETPETETWEFAGKQALLQGLESTQEEPGEN